MNKPMNSMPTRTNRVFLPLLLLAALLLLTTCGSGAPVLDDEATLSLSAVPNTLKNNGGSARVLVRAMLNGQPVVDGTTIWLQTDKGSLPEKVTLVGGNAEVWFTSDERIGQASLKAGRNPGEENATTTVTIEDSIIPLGEPFIAYTPTNLTAAGGSVDIRVRVTGQNNEPLPGESVVMSTTYGRLERGRTVAKTDLDGWVTQRLEVSADPNAPEELELTFKVRDQVISGNFVTITPNQNPEPMIQVSHETAQAGDVVVFTSAGSSDPDSQGAPADDDLVWRFGDNSAAVNGITVEHRYSRPGTYTASLTMTDALGAAVTVSEAVVIEPPAPNEAPTAAITISPTDPRDRHPVTFNAEQSSDPDGEIVSYRWFFGDGQQDQGPEVTKAYQGAGEYTVTLTVEDNDGALSSQTETVKVIGNEAPLAELRAAGETFRPGDPVSFDATESTDPEGDELVAYTFDFGDGSSRITQNFPTVTHTYAEQGVYVARVMVRDREGATDFATTTVAVTNRRPPRAFFEFDPKNDIVPGTNILFNAGGSNGEDAPIVTYSWRFGDGFPGAGAQTTHSYLESGEYTVSLTVIDEYGARATTVQVVRVAEP